MPNFNDDSQLRRVDDLRAKEAEKLSQLLADKYQLPYLDLSQTAINTDALRLIPEIEAREAGVAAFKLVGRTISLAIMSPNNQKLNAILEDLKGKNFAITLYLASEIGVARAWERYREISRSERTEAGLIEISSEVITEIIPKIKTLDDIKNLLGVEAEKTLSEGGITGIVEMILAGALVTEASDIHLEPEEEDIRLRYRLDGVLEDITHFNKKINRQVNSRLKLMSGLKLNVTQSAQDGRFSIKIDDVEIEIRTSVLPGAYGETIVLRVLNPKNIAVSFTDLGIETHLFEIFNREIRKPNGLILLTGPTGSGKTTTLYAFLREINNPESKIITIEDPIEYHLNGVSQTQVNRAKKYTFLSGLRAALRQDPDVIMVGEIRDEETAKIAINSALTGHLVLSTLHTNNAAGTIPRLIDLGINPKIMSSSLTVAAAQRLVRKLCLKCRQEKVTDTKELELINKVLANIKAKRPEFNPLSASWRSGKTWEPVGCEDCHQTGYKGRIGVFEAIIMDDSIAQVATTNPSERDIVLAAKPQKILDMREDGVLKVVSGVTALAELGRVIDLDAPFF
ncbi:MAG: type II/IV secretion system protein [Candidatus Vogelbacteria bacterium]|nr:type II/IV secretion system protein [Candidatus Vogelbacteria bacterium]